MVTEWEPEHEEEEEDYFHLKEHCLQVFDKSLGAIKDYLGSDARHELLAVFNEHFPPENMTAMKIKRYIDEAASATEVMPVYQVLPPSQAALVPLWRTCSTQEHIMPIIFKNDLLPCRAFKHITGSLPEAKEFSVESAPVVRLIRRRANN
ncbi:hypothetical protein MFLAVUS_011483 [Mucor flavus]|uniref:Uncharacterized protein n=1 Tax=Mucor flavus TaxID=439312 RepID=A0ABP9ZFL1_9FUNG